MTEARKHRIPAATYRLQFNKSFTFRHALEWLDCLQALGITDVYASPFVVARSGSIHGYDVVDPRAINPEIGTERDLECLHEALVSRGMGLIMDLVPNHMCVNTNDNIWWNDVLENGPSSRFASFFDIDWRPSKPELRDKVLLPVLGDQYGKVLESGELQLTGAEGLLSVTYCGRRFPLDPVTYPMVLCGAAGRLRERNDSDAAAAGELESIIANAKRLPPRSETRAERIRERQGAKETLKSRLQSLLSGSGVVRQALQEELREMNGSKGMPRSFDRLEELLAAQGYRLSYWRVAAEHVNYRRFFEINDLAAVRVEEPEVFEIVHGKAFELMEKGWVTGFRVDHIDGLQQPKRYLEDIQRRGGASYVVVEKILARGEEVPPGWPTEGTTGYEFLNVLNGLFVSQRGEESLRSFCDGWRTVRGSFADIVYASKRLILDASMSSELSVLARRLDRISEQHRWSRDFTIRTLEEVLAATVASFPVYRTYMAAEDVEVSSEDAAHIREALQAGKQRSTHVSASAFDFLGEVLLSQHPEGLSDRERVERRDFVLRFQELTGPVAAKGIEDTAFYRYFPLLSLNEVGGTPARFGVSVEEFHEQMEVRARVHPAALSATSTHDTKRAEDNRARLNAISEIPEAWIAAVTEWRELAQSMKTNLNGVAVPDFDEEYYIYQTLIGAWPTGALDDEEYSTFSSRVQYAVEKAIKEAKRNTSWIHPNPAYEEAIQTFVSRILDRNGTFAPKFEAFVSQILLPGLLTSLAQVVIKTTAPGVPDFFQGTELWDFSLVDPDNRRRVDFGKRRTLLSDLDRSYAFGLKAIHDLWRTPEDGRVKLFVTSRLLRRRLDEGELFARGSYCGLDVAGRRKDNVVAFARRWQSRVSLTMTGRFFTQLGEDARRVPSQEDWGDTVVRIPSEWAVGDVEDALTGAKFRLSSSSVRIAEVFDVMPYAVLVGNAGASP
jgi:(1->4)-alpha-D-glucan 1-alpha-D-glucosylmutase